MKGFIGKQVKFETSYPSLFGSHASMINEEETAKLNDPEKVVLKDDWGLYTTDRCRLDKGMADPNRNATWRFDAQKKGGSDKK